MRGKGRWPTGRDSSLDLLKWLALVSMLLDHLRFVWPALGWLYPFGRLAFPFFCLAIAANLARGLAAPEPRRLLRYLGALLVFALLAEVPYRLLVGDAATLNVLPTLALGLSIAQALRQPRRGRLLLAGAALALAIVCNRWLMFGAAGALLPAACLLVLRRPLWCAALPGLVCLAANWWPPLFAEAAAWQPFALLVLGMCLVAPALGLAVLRVDTAIGVPPLRRWGYLLYPGHFLLLAAVRALVRMP
ncbi:TraX family protein [Pseudomonas kuykendallii]|uniref:Conjugal transfer protein TraX n=1 Tax=Pseudomonas kuykendallii TaxID=1007099 RepID=A0A2W5CVA2_9PSED|nr:TraX family protein [Pseudomonas kuykendallii]PZP22153.1 MAG: conjugal transfer protein TraX [Pseudomonas kuykendallii]